MKKRKERTSLDLVLEGYLEREERRREDLANGVVETTAKRVWTWREPVGACIPTGFWLLSALSLYGLNRLDALSISTAAGFFIFAILFRIDAEMSWESRCIDQLYRKYPPRSRYTPSAPLTVSTTSLPKCPPGIEAMSVNQ